MTRYRIWDPHALDMYEHAGLTHRQRTLVESVLRSLEPGSYLSENVSCASSLPLALTRAHHAMEGYASVNQPKLGLTRAVLDHSLSTIISGDEAFGVTGVATAAITSAQRTLTEVMSGISASPSSADKRRFANNIDALVEPAAY